MSMAKTNVTYFFPIADRNFTAKSNMLVCSNLTILSNKQQQIDYDLQFHLNLI